MEELLNKLLKKGWEPFGAEMQKAREGVYCKNYFFFEGCADGVTIRQLVSKESGLWQFVCKNGMVKHEIYEDLHSWTFTTADHSDFWYTSGDNYEYRLIESALKDESELEQFLLENIKV